MDALTLKIAMGLVVVVIIVISGTLLLISLPH